MERFLASAASLRKVRAAVRDLKDELLDNEGSPQMVVQVTGGVLAD